MKKYPRFLITAVFCLILTNCQTAPLIPTPTPLPPTPTLIPEPTPIPTVPPSPTRTLDSGWQSLRNGFERRNLTLPATDNRPTERLYLLRIDPTLYQFGVAYKPGQLQSLSQWQTESDALLVVNGGYFTPENVATGLVITDGEASGISYGSFAGMFTVTPQTTEIRWLQQQPYAPDEPIQYALQSFPLLVKPGGVLGFPDEDGARARRTVVAQDVNGRILFLIATSGGITLHQLSQYLVDSDLNIDVALNLDGGPSSGLLLAEPFEEVPALSTLPTVITVFPK